MRTVLLGDSHLARIRRDLRRLGEDVLNAARGGATVHDLDTQTAAVGIARDDVVAVSVGTNDAAGWRTTSPSGFGEALEQFLGSHEVGRWVVVLPPGVVERTDGAGDRTNAGIDRFRTAATRAASAARAEVLDPRTVLSPLGSSAFADDGLHLSGAGYRALLPALRAATRQRE